MALKLYRQRHEKLRYFEPNDIQCRWIDEIARPGAFIVVNASGNGGGKTYGLVAVLGAFFWPQIAPPCFSADIFQHFAYPKRARIVSTPKEVEEIGSFQTTIRELWPRGRFEAVKKGKTYDSQFKTDTGWVIDIMTYEQDRTEFAGPNLGIIAFNEPPPKDIYDECLMRTRKGGIVLMAMTSLRENVWVIDGVLGRANGKEIRLVYGDIEENCADHSPKGTLRHEKIEQILAQYDPDEREARKTGRGLVLSGRVFKGFSQETYVAKASLPVIPGAPKFQVIDPAGINKPWAVIWGQVVNEPIHGLQILREWPEGDKPGGEFESLKDPNLRVDQYVDIFSRIEQGLAWKDANGVMRRDKVNRIIDRRFANVKNVQTGKSIKEMLSEAGYSFQDSYSVPGEVPEIETGIQAVKNYLRVDAITKRPMLLVDPSCRNTTRALERWSRDPKTGHPMDDVWKNFADTVRYLASAELKFGQTISDSDWSNREGQPRWT